MSSLNAWIEGFCNLIMATTIITIPQKSLTIPLIRNASPLKGTNSIRILGTFF